MVLIALAVIGILIGLISMFFVNLTSFQGEVEIRDAGDEEEKSSSNLDTKIKRTFYVFLIVFSVWALVNITSYLDQASKYRDTRADATLSDVVSSFGLEPGKEYPIVIGDRTTVGSGQVSYGGMFYIKGAGEWASNTSILVSFEGDNGYYILEIPISKITFDIRPDVTEASMSVDVPKMPEPRSVAYWQHSYACSDSIWRYGWVLMDCTALPPNLVVSDDTVRQGLAPVVTDAFKESAGARITLSPSMYNDILGTRTAGSPVE